MNAHKNFQTQYFELLKRMFDAGMVLYRNLHQLFQPYKAGKLRYTFEAIL